MNKLFVIIKDILYVSKLTKTKKKKILITNSILLSQLTAGTDLLLIGVFASIIANQYTNLATLNEILNFFNNNRAYVMLIIIFRYLLNYYQFSILKKIEIDVTVNIKSYMFDKVLDQKNFSRSDTYYFIDTLAVHIAFFYSNFAALLNYSLQTIAYITYLVISDISLITFFGIGVLLLALPIFKLIKIAKNYMHERYIIGQVVTKDLVNAIENLPLIKMLRMEEIESNNYLTSLKKVYNIAFKNYQIGFVNQQLPNFFTLIVFAVILNLKSFYSRITLDFLGVTIRLFQSLSNITNSLSQVVNSQIHIQEFVNIQNFNKKQNKDYLVLTNNNKIELKKIYFKYANSENYLFKNLNIAFEKDSHNIVIGPNGSGKSTLLGLIGNVLIPESGSCELFSEKLSYIGATPFIFSKTLRENIMYGNQLHIKDSEIHEIMFKLDIFKEKNNYELNRLIDNTSLSSGQMQKIAFARALLSNPEILLLDEAMANLDDKSTEIVLNILKEKKVTVINSTHDPELYTSVDNMYKIEIDNEHRSIIKI